MSVLRIPLFSFICSLIGIPQMLANQGISNKNPSKLTVPEPSFAYPIWNTTTPIGKEATLTCAVDDLGKYKVGWLRAEDQTILTLHERVVTHNSRISVSHENNRAWNLHIRQVKHSDKGCYMCQINTSIMKKQIGCLDVNVPPDILYQETSGDVNTAEGDNTTLTCKATGNPQPRISWRREDGAPIVTRQSAREHFNVTLYEGEKLPFYRIDRKQMGVYLCIAANEVPPAVSKRITLSVNFGPMVQVPNQLLGAPLGTDVLLECLVEAFPSTINYWVKRRGGMLLNGQKFSIEEKRHSYKITMSMLIRNFEAEDVGTYNCVTTNSIGRAEGTIRLYELKPEHKLSTGSSPQDKDAQKQLSSTNHHSISSLTVVAALSLLPLLAR